MIRVCSRCKEEKSEYASGRLICKRCDLKRVSLWAKNNRQSKTASNLKWRITNRRSYLRYRLRSDYNFSEDIIKKILVWSGGVCICGKILTKLGRKIDDGCIDHNHKTGEFRGIICGACNRALGMVKENPETLNAMVVYLGRQL